MKIPKLRWVICFLLFTATMFCFLDRLVLSMIADKIKEFLKLSDIGYANVTTPMLFSYALMFLIGGRLLDKLGTRWGLGISVAFWSLASAAHGLIQSPFQLGLARFCLGAGEGACFPGAAKAVAEWFPKKERAFATGIAIGGVSLGCVFAPWFTHWCLINFSWRAAFLVTGLLGAGWLVFWFMIYQRPEQSQWITQKEKDYILSDAENSSDQVSLNQIQDAAEFQDPTEGEQTSKKILSENRSSKQSAVDAVRSAEEAPKESLWSLFRRKDVIGLSLARVLFDPVFWIYMIWIPLYLKEERGVSDAEIKSLVWIPYLALGVSNIVGGFASDLLVKWGVRPIKARKGIMIAAALLTTASGFAAFASTPLLAVLMMAALMFAHGFWITNYVTLITDRFPRHSVGTVMGITGMLGTFSGMCANTMVGFIAQHFSYTSVWIASGCLYPLAMAAILLTVRQNSEIEAHWPAINEKNNRMNNKKSA